MKVVQAELLIEKEHILWNGCVLSHLSIQFVIIVVKHSKLWLICQKSVCFATK